MVDYLYLMMGKFKWMTENCIYLYMESNDTNTMLTLLTVFYVEEGYAICRAKENFRILRKKVKRGL